ncbi:nucleoside triphosphate pyrophosphohydrolase [Sporosarcina sp. SAFN-010]|uniref:nucleoside triphosphate pyrophosphohydrolase n=1 Tax=Sporosarcina sp. SAFN-010 TaxID=3387273 RepID=UPI003F808C28
MRTYNKLVRDKIPEIINQNGEICEIQTLDQSKYYSELRIKLKEELNEYLETKNDEEAIEELSDILEVIYSLSKIHGKGFKDVEEVRQKKFYERGGFEKKLYLMNVGDDK